MIDPVTQIDEPLRTPVAETAAVVVCGAGPAGVAAAVAAGRAQQKLGLAPDVRLIEAHGQLGGVWTSGLLSWILDGQNKVGLMPEILASAEDYRRRHGGRPSDLSGRLYDPEHMKRLLERLCLDAGVRLRLHTTVAAADVRHGRLHHVVTQSKSGRHAFAGSCFVDCTGDGDLAAYAGCAYDFGLDGDRQHPATAAQPMTLMALVTGIDTHHARPFYDRHTLPYDIPYRALIARDVDRLLLAGRCISGGWRASSTRGSSARSSSPSPRQVVEARFTAFSPNAARIQSRNAASSPASRTSTTRTSRPAPSSARRALRQVSQVFRPWITTSPMPFPPWNKPRPTLVVSVT